VDNTRQQLTSAQTARAHKRALFRRPHICPNRQVKIEEGTVEKEVRKAGVSVSAIHWSSFPGTREDSNKKCMYGRVETVRRGHAEEKFGGRSAVERAIENGLAQERGTGRYPGGNERPGYLGTDSSNGGKAKTEKVLACFSS